eukprot:GEZU01016210.1.p2 GENE.GEZU01016210.1~~GEZU01016210.1.p2  ORF type:complete len:193 (-),score=54.89 GEZU01016210.1:128-706(-)
MADLAQGRAAAAPEQRQAQGRVKSAFPSDLIAATPFIDPTMLKTSFFNAVVFWNDANNRERFFEIFDPNCVVMGVRYFLPPNLDGLKMLFRLLWKAIPDAVFVIEDCVVEGNRACVKFNVQGTHSGEYPPGIPATNKRVIINEMAYIIFNPQGRVVYKWLMCDDLDLLTQLGITDTTRVKPAPGVVQQGAQV